jgi:TonB family protein
VPVSSPFLLVNQIRTVRRFDLGEVNKQALKIPLVDYPPAAMAAGVYGIVKVRVWIDKKGDVIRAVVVAGPRLLRRVTLQSAKGARFPPNLGDCDPCHVTGFLVYTFERPRKNDE